MYIIEYFRQQEFIYRTLSDGIYLPPYQTEVHSVTVVPAPAELTVTAALPAALIAAKRRTAPASLAYLQCVLHERRFRFCFDKSGMEMLPP